MMALKKRIRRMSRTPETMKVEMEPDDDSNDNEHHLENTNRAANKGCNSTAGKTVWAKNSTL